MRVKEAAGWEYDPKAMEFEHVKLLHKRNRKERPKNNELAPDIMVFLIFQYYWEGSDKSQRKYHQIPDSRLAAVNFTSALIVSHHI